MLLLRRNLKSFTMYRARFRKDKHGDGKNVYDKPAAVFEGNIQPAGEKADVKEYGIKREYAHYVYTTSCLGFKETDRITDGVKWYEVKTITPWPSYTRLLVGEVAANGRH